MAVDSNGTNGNGATPVADPEAVRTAHREPLKPTGKLAEFKSFDVTPVIGTEFPEVKLLDWLEAPNSDELLRELAITVSRRGVVIFRAQDGITTEHQKELARRLGKLSGGPATSDLHIHPVNNSRQNPGVDDYISMVGDKQVKNYGGIGGALSNNADGKRQSSRQEWHTDIQWERVPCDYSVLRMEVIPPTGGDTMYASGYEIYDRISAPYQKFLESLSVTCSQVKYVEAAKKLGIELFEGPRGAPENTGIDLAAVHPLVRTNPVTGWKSIFGAGIHIEKINGLSPAESDHLKDVFLRLIVENHDLQARCKWQNPNDVAIWDNRSVFHAATVDYSGARRGYGARSIGEPPYFDPESISRRQGLYAEATQA
ncbi:TfdA family taurine catabolism dioxygenase TauD [Cercophora scortea]|uniref:TfdA family taurine catabolism dioxygenase TauD n=1 Tax=Cercophora scortea TaxID=314031 RepID=A0AAE0MI06_9PEZI|nr:TfdA family taurine catabolism dioxygenase TauD [Cercophora scortea]